MNGTDMATAENDARLGNARDRRYCDRCGAQIQGAGAWGHDDNCPKREEEDRDS